MSSTPLYPTPSHEALKQRFVGTSIQHVHGPAAIVDLAVVRKNCDTMLNVTHSLGLDFRAHVKTHKTIDATQLQVGCDATKDVRIVVSTIAEANQHFPLLRQLQRQGRRVNMLYGIPPSANAFQRLQYIRTELGPDSVSFLIDDPAQLQHFSNAALPDEGLVSLFIKVDVGYHRAGLSPASESLASLLKATIHLRSTGGRRLLGIAGFYSHNSLSYAASNPNDAMDYLADELQIASEAAKLAKDLDIADNKPITISVGATPTVTAAYNLLGQSSSTHQVRGLLKTLQQDFNIELHAGVYAFLDLQQIATHARPMNSSEGVPTMQTSDIALRIQAEVLSVYTERERPEALIGAGTLALGREPCKNYTGWGILAPTPWSPALNERIYSEEQRLGWIVSRISQEHGVITWQGSEDELRKVSVGDKVWVWPNHACIASAGFDWYLVVDSAGVSGKLTDIIDVWIRCRGW